MKGVPFDLDALFRVLEMWRLHYQHWMIWPESNNHYDETAIMISFGVRILRRKHCKRFPQPSSSSSPAWLSMSSSKSKSLANAQSQNSWVVRMEDHHDLRLQNITRFQNLQSFMNFDFVTDWSPQVEIFKILSKVNIISGWKKEVIYMLLSFLGQQNVFGM